MFQFRRFPTYTYGFSARCLDMTPDGLLHSEISGSKPTYGSPKLIAVSRVLHRLPVPRHSPCALCSLTMCFLVLLEIVDLSIKSSSFLDSFLALSASFLYSVFNVHQLRWRDVRQLRWTDARLRINPRARYSPTSAIFSRKSVQLPSGVF